MAAVPENINSLLIFLIVIAIIGLSLFLNIANYYFKRKSDILRTLFLIFLFFTLGMITNIIGIWLHYIVFVENGETYEPIGGIEVYILKLFIAYRIAFVFLILSIYYSFILREMIFEKEIVKKKKNLHQFLVLFSLCFTILVYKWHGFIYDLIDFILMFILMAIVYFPFAKEANNLAKKIDEPIYRKAIKSLYFMSVCIIIQFFLFVLERIVVTITKVGFSIFYYFAWGFGILALLGAYLGYIRPKQTAKEN